MTTWLLLILRENRGSRGGGYVGAPWRGARALRDGSANANADVVDDSP
jgi:hypothetical protein